MQSIIATFENGVLKPSQPIHLAEHTQVRLTVEPLTEEEQLKRNQEILAALEALWRNIKICSDERLTRDQLHERQVDKRVA